MKNPVYLSLVLVSTWTAVSARDILQSFKLRLWAKHAVKQIQFEKEVARKRLSLLGLEHKNNRN